MLNIFSKGSQGVNLTSVEHGRVFKAITFHNIIKVMLNMFSVLHFSCVKV